MKPCRYVNFSSSYGVEGIYTFMYGWTEERRQMKQPSVEGSFERRSVHISNGHSAGYFPNTTTNGTSRRVSIISGSAEYIKYSALCSITQGLSLRE